MTNKPVIDARELQEIEQSFYKDMPDYSAIKNGGDLLAELGDNGMKWAAAFCQITKKQFDISLDLMYVMGWFANAIEHSSDVRRRRPEVVTSQSESEEPWASIDVASVQSSVNLAPDYSLPV